VFRPASKRSGLCEGTQEEAILPSVGTSLFISCDEVIYHAFWPSTRTGETGGLAKALLPTRSSPS
jgi:hypothetical protein